MSLDTPSIRRAYHAGSWYSSNRSDLDEILSGHLSGAEEELGKTRTNSESGSPRSNIPRGVISPHAGFSYSGPTAAYAYHALSEALKTWSWSGTVVVLHPSHHVYLDGCAVSSVASVETPLCNLPIDESLRSELLNTGEFTIMEKETDEREHSGEMQYPFIAKVYLDSKEEEGFSLEKGREGKHTTPNLRVLPIMVGALSNSQEEHFGKILAPYLAREGVFTVVSSDFCHWGKRFGYNPTSPPDHIKTPKSVKEIYQYIEWMDHLGMDEIASQQPGAFATYIKIYKNTICGRHPIAVYLSALKENNESGAEEVDLAFVKYDQSSHATHADDSSVSYASAVARKI